MEIMDEAIPAYHSVEVPATTDVTLTAGEDDCYLLLLQGKPINEPVVQYGPFVMNTEAEIRDAFEEYRKTQFGGWPWPKEEFAHDKNKGRFALHANGNLEIKNE
jgi:hypothetical protein